MSDVKLPKHIVDKINRMNEHTRKAALLSYEVQEWLEKQGCNLQGLDSDKMKDVGYDRYEISEISDEYSFNEFVLGCEFADYAQQYSVNMVSSYLKKWRDIETDLAYAKMPE